MQTKSAYLVGPNKFSVETTDIDETNLAADKVLLDIK